MHRLHTETTRSSDYLLKTVLGRRTERSAAIVHALGAKFKSMGETVFYESASGVGLKRSDYCV